MKIRAIILHNVRRFAGITARLTGIADGITTICEPNETGKSTFFDALHALLFFDHKSSTAEVRSLQPYSKGAVEIAADIETPQGNFRIEKKFLSSKSARVTNLSTGQIVAQEGEAEAWIAKAIGTDMLGPAGLLWVRQGTNGFGPDGTGVSEKRERDRLRDVRQSLMSSVAGQIDSVTGGRRLDIIMKNVEADLDALATKSLGPKISGEWGKAAKLAADLTDARDQLKQQVLSLEQALKERSAIRDRLGDPKSAETEILRARAISKVEAELDAALQQAKQLEDAARELTLAELQLKSIDDRLTAKAVLASRHTRLIGEIAIASGRLKAAEGESTDTEQRFENATSYHHLTLEKLTQARVSERYHQDLKTRIVAAKRRKDIENLLGRVAGYEAKLRNALDAKKNIRITPELLADIEQLALQVSAAIERRDAGATQLSVTYAGMTKITTAAGTEIANAQPFPVYTAISLNLPGIGQMSIVPPHDVGSETSAKALEQDLKERLDLLGFANIAAARQAAALLDQIKRDEDAALGALTALVPDGIEELRRELAEEAPADIDVKPETLEVSLSVVDAESAELDARTIMEAARRDQASAAARLLEGKTTLRMQREALASLESELSKMTDDDDLSGSHAEAAGEVEIRRVMHANLRDAVPNFETLEAEKARLLSASNNAKADRQRQSERLHQLDGEIGARADDAVESRLAEVEGELERALARAERYQFEVRVLAELRAQLETARSEARDAYFEPIKKELIPLIAMLYEGADLVMDPETMLPTKIRRGDVEDDFDMLSGGATEQIAILTRLAFARLYAKQGRQIPIILDDALVYSDDDRIVRMFTALTKISKDQQIIVFSCRSRAFEELGGHRPRIEVAGRSGFV